MKITPSTTADQLTECICDTIEDTPPVDNDSKRHTFDYLKSVLNEFADCIEKKSELDKAKLYILSQEQVDNMISASMASVTSRIMSMIEEYEDKENENVTAIDADMINEIIHDSIQNAMNDADNA